MYLRVHEKILYKNFIALEVNKNPIGRGGLCPRLALLPPLLMSQVLPTRLRTSSLLGFCFSFYNSWVYGSTLIWFHRWSHIAALIKNLSQFTRYLLDLNSSYYAQNKHNLNFWERVSKFRKLYSNLKNVGTWKIQFENFYSKLRQILSKIPTITYRWKADEILFVCTSVKASSSCRACGKTLLLMSSFGLT